MGNLGKRLLRTAKNIIFWIFAFIISFLFLQSLFSTSISERNGNRIFYLLDYGVVIAAGLAVFVVLLTFVRRRIVLNRLKPKILQIQIMRGKNLNKWLSAATVTWFIIQIAMVVRQVPAAQGRERLLCLGSDAMLLLAIMAVSRTATLYFDWRAGQGTYLLLLLFAPLWSYTAPLSDRILPFTCLCCAIYLRRMYQQTRKKKYLAACLAGLGIFVAFALATLSGMTAQNGVTSGLIPAGYDSAEAFFTRIATLWNDPSFGKQVAPAAQNMYLTLLVLENIMQSATLFGIMLYIFFRRKKKVKREMSCMLVFLCSFLFFAIWENAQQDICLFYVFLFPYTVQGYLQATRDLLELVETTKKLEKKRRSGKLPEEPKIVELGKEREKRARAEQEQQQLEIHLPFLKALSATHAFGQGLCLQLSLSRWQSAMHHF
jgi:hypothetical protein